MNDQVRLFIKSMTSGIWRVKPTISNNNASVNLNYYAMRYNGADGKSKLFIFSIENIGHSWSNWVETKAREVKDDWEIIGKKPEKLNRFIPYLIAFEERFGFYYL